MKFLTALREKAIVIIAVVLLITNEYLNSGSKEGAPPKSARVYYIQIVDPRLSYNPRLSEPTNSVVNIITCTGISLRGYEYY